MQVVDYSCADQGCCFTLVGMFRAAAVIPAIVFALCACSSGEATDPPSDEVFASRMASEVFDSTIVAVPESVSFAESVCTALDGGVFDPADPKLFLDAFAERLRSEVPSVSYPRVQRQIELSVEWKCPEYSDAVQLWIATP